MEEFLDTFDKSGNFLGVKPKSFCHNGNPNCYHKTVWVWIMDSKNRILVQRRAHCKKFMPDKWDMPSAGHVPSGEDFLSACARETAEELGIVFDRESFVFQREFCSQFLWELGQVYLLRADFELSQVKLQREEVASVSWLEYSEFEKLLYSDEFVPHEKEYKDWVCQMLKSNMK